MGQEQVEKVLKKSDKPLSRTEIALVLQDNEIQKQAVKVSMVLRRMLKYNEVKCVEISKEQALKKFKCKRRMRLYYI